jgi:glyoxylase-like metal-dependent hydrolase (beta-lactamase superfamily II)
MGAYQTNCYIVKTKSGDIIIDPGMGAIDFVLQNATKPLAILNTHGHFDHVWSNAEVKEALNIPIYCPKDDEFMLRADHFGMSVPPSSADVLVEPDAKYLICENEVIFHFFPGHTPGCSMIEIDGTFFSGDFIFQNSIGRTDFPYSNPKDMAKSLQKFATFTENCTIYPGHGDKTCVFDEQKNISYWLRSLA